MHDTTPIHAHGPSVQVAGSVQGVPAVGHGALGAWQIHRGALGGGAAPPHHVGVSQLHTPSGYVHVSGAAPCTQLAISP
jgi:hypothetical protein